MKHKANQKSTKNCNAKVAKVSTYAGAKVAQCLSFQKQPHCLVFISSPKIDSGLLQSK
jgi:hypothetical protein